MKYFDRTRLMGAGRDNGFGLEFGVVVALALPSAERLFTPSPSRFPDNPAAKIKLNKHHCASLQTSKNYLNSQNPSSKRTYFSSFTARNENYLHSPFLRAKHHQTPARPCCYR